MFDIKIDITNIIIIIHINKYLIGTIYDYLKKNIFLIYLIKYSYLKITW